MSTRLYHPKYWLSWVWVGLLRAIGLLPFPIIYALGSVLGNLIYMLLPSRVHITLVNLKLCLPELSGRERKKIARRHFRLIGCSLLSIGAIWWSSRKRLRRLVKLKGMPHLEQALSQGNGVILLAPHFVALDCGGIMLSSYLPVSSLYLPHKDPVFDYVSLQQRSRFGADMFDRRAPLAQLIRSIRSGKPFHYSPDQNAGADHGVFAPFFGVQASTYPTLAKMTRAGKAVVIPFLNRFTWRGIESSLFAPLENFPVGDVLQDTTRMNQVVEDLIRQATADYLWSHKRFKRSPDGAPNVYETTKLD